MHTYIHIAFPDPPGHLAARFPVPERARGALAAGAYIFVCCSPAALFPVLSML